MEEPPKLETKSVEIMTEIDSKIAKIDKQIQGDSRVEGKSQERSTDYDMHDARHKTVLP
jgi:hypothetical protein